MDVVLWVVLGLIALAIVVILVRGGARDDEAPAPGRASRPAAAARKTNWLVGKGSKMRGKHFHVGQRTATIGRGMGNLVQIGDEVASKVHAQLIGSASGMSIKDMGSSNGTRVNGQKLEPDVPRRLEDGDEIAIGETVFAYRRSGDFVDQALTGAKDVRASQQPKTQALSAIGGAGGLQAQIEQAVADAGGDYEAAAAQVGLDVELVKKIVDAE